MNTVSSNLVTFQLPMIPGGEVMGEVRVKVRLSNAADEALVRRGVIAPDEVRSKTVEAIVDTGAVCTVLPEDLAQELGLAITRQSVARYANGQTETVGTTEPVFVEFVDIEERRASDEALIVGDEVLIGQTVLERTDLLVDCAGQQLLPRHPGGPVLYIRQTKSSR
jgi:predicted aspartyl protease